MRDHPRLEVESGWALSIDQRPVNLSITARGVISGSVAEEVVIAMRPGEVVDEDPEERDQSLPGLGPLTRPRDHRDVAPATTIPGDVPLRGGGGDDGLLGSGQFGPLHAGSTLATVGRRGLVQVGVGAKAADPCQAAPMPVSEGGHLMAAETAVADQNEAAAAGPAHEHGHQLPQQGRGGLVTSVVLATPLGRPIQGHEHGRSRARR